MRRVLHVLRQFEPGGIEFWLRDLVLAGGVPGFSIEFLVETEQPGRLETDITGAGAVVHRCTRGNWIGLRHLLESRRIHAVHSHVHAFSAFILSAATAAGVRVRIAHSHCREDGRESWKRRPYFAAMRRWLRTAATSRLAVSRFAGESLFGNLDFRILPCARRWHPLTASPSRTGKLTIGHVGRAVPEKNHAFLHQIASRIDCRLLLSTDTTPSEIYANADVFVFPSIREGLGLALIEAQAAGLPCVVSDGVPEEACVVPGLVQQIPLAAGLDVWCEAIQGAAKLGRRADALAWIARSPYDLDANIAALSEVYSGAA